MTSISKSHKELDEIEKPSALISLIFVNKGKSSLQGLEKFKSLIELDLTGNKLTNAVPEILMLKFLKKLNISKNSISSIWELPNSLEQLNLSENSITTLDPILPQLTKLQILNLSHNHITCIKSLSLIPSLKVLNLSYNRLKSTEGLENCRTLVEVDLEFNTLEILTDFFSVSSMRLINLKNNPCSREIRSLDLFGFMSNEDGVYFRDNGSGKSNKYGKLKTGGSKSKREEYCSKKLTPSFRSRNTSMQEIYDQVINEDPEMESFASSDSEDPVNEHLGKRPSLSIAKLQLEKIHDKSIDKISTEKWSTKPESTVEFLLEDYIHYCGLSDMIEKGQSGDKNESLFRVLKQREDERKHLSKAYEDLLQQSIEMQQKNEILQSNLTKKSDLIQESLSEIQDLKHKIELLKQRNEDLAENIRIEKSNFVKAEEELIERIRTLEDERNSARFNLSSSYESEITLTNDYQDLDMRKFVNNHEAIVPVEVADYIQKLLNKISTLVTKNKKIRLQREKYKFLLVSKSRN